MIMLPYLLFFQVSNKYTRYSVSLLFFMGSDNAQPGNVQPDNPRPLVHGFPSCTLPGALLGCSILVRGDNWKPRFAQGGDARLRRAFGAVRCHDYWVANYRAAHYQAALYRAGFSRYGVIIRSHINIAQPDNPRPLFWSRIIGLYIPWLYINRTLFHYLPFVLENTFEIGTKKSDIILMLLFLIIFVETVKICATQTSTGTALFYNKQIGTHCWSPSDVARLRSRKIVNQLIPRQVAPEEINQSFAHDALRYYRQTLNTVKRRYPSEFKALLLEVLADTFGGHLRSELLPSARLAYYAGYVPYKPVRELHDLYDELKTALNTQGIGWNSPPKIPQVANLTVFKIQIGRGRLFDPCKHLVIKRDSNACIRMPTPIMDDEKEPTAIALPLKNGGLFNMMSPSSENIVLKYYTTATRCILSRSPVTCRHSDISNFNKDLWCWMKTDVAPHLMDEKLYSAFGGILRIAAAVQNYGKVVSRRNLFGELRKPRMQLNSWKKLTEPYFFIDTDWTATLYIGLVALSAFSICLLQVCYNHLCGGGRTPCDYGAQTERKESLHVHTSYPKFKQEQQQKLLATKSTCFNEQQLICSSPQSREEIKSPRSPVKTQRVYDYNDNLLDVIMSDAEEGEYCSTDSNIAQEAKIKNDHCVRHVSQVTRPTSPPKIETPMEQLKIDRGRVSIRGNDAILGDRWSSTDDASSSCDESASSGSSTSRPRARHTRERDLAWARQVLRAEFSPSRTRPSRTSPCTEMDSHTTSTSQR